MTDKEVIIDGKKEKAKVLFECKHVKDLAAYDMLKNGIAITPENAPVGDFKLMLVENTKSVYGFSSICKRSSKEDVWEYMGFGHSGASSIVTALLKELNRKEQECAQLKIQVMQKDEFNMFFNTPVEGWDNDPCKICEYKQDYERLQAENEELK